MKTGSEKIRDIMESIEGIDKKRKVMDALLSFPQDDLLQMYVDEFTDQEAMEYWLEVDADALPETPEIAREWLKANYAEEESSSLADMIFDGWDENDIQKMYSIYYDNDAETELDEIMGSELQSNEVEIPKISYQQAQDLLDVAANSGIGVPEIAQDALAYYRNDAELDEIMGSELPQETGPTPGSPAQRSLDRIIAKVKAKAKDKDKAKDRPPYAIDYGEDMPELAKAASEDPQAWHRAMWGDLDRSRNEMTEDADEFGYDGEAEMDRESTVQTQIDDIVTKSNAIIDKIGPDGEPTSDQERIINGFADEITRLEQSLED